MSDLLRLIGAGNGSAWKDVVERLRRIGADDDENASVDGSLQVRANAAELYARYMVNSNELTVCHDFIVQPQVRILIKKMLMCVYGRILELKQILIDQDFSIYTPIAEQLVTLRTTFDEFEMIVPRCFQDERRPFLNNIDKRIDEILHRRTATVANDSVGVTLDAVDLQVPTGGLSITGQSISGETSDSELDVTKFIHDKKQSMPLSRFRLTTDGEIARQIALKLIQIHIRAMRDRVIVNDKLSAWKTRENIISGKYINPSKEKAREAAVKIQKYWRFYRIMRRTKVRTQKLYELIGMRTPSHRPNYDDFIRERDDKIRARQAKAEVEFRNVTNKLQRNLNPYHKDEIVEEMEHKVDLCNRVTEKIAMKDSVAEKKQIKHNASTDGFPELSYFTIRLAELFNDFDCNWTTDKGIDERPREELIKAEIFANIRVQNKDTVDHTIKKAHARDKEPKKKSKKKSSSARSKKKKRPNPNEIFEELVKNGMIKKSEIFRFSDFQGEVSYCSSTSVGERYCLGDIRQIIKELFVIGLISSELRALKNIKFMKSLLLVGPSKSGKTLLTNAVCTETGSLKIELTLENVSANCQSVANVNRLADLIIEFAKTFQPVVIEVNLADIPFYKKIPKDIKLLYKPSLMKKLIEQLMKKLKATEQVIIIGKATTPWLTNERSLTKAYQAIVFTVSDYKSVFTLVNSLLMSYPWVSWKFPVTPLAAMLVDCPRQAIADIVAETMTPERVLMLRHRPLEYTEFMPAVLKTSKELGLRDRYHDWYMRHVPLGVKRLKIEEEEEKPVTILE